MEDRSKRIIGGLVFTVALAGGGVVGVALGTPSLSGAQEPTTETTEGTAGADGTGLPDWGRRHGPRGFVGEAAVEIAAPQLGMTEDELHAALRDGSTVAELAAERGVDLDALTTAIVADATARIDAAVAAGDLDAERAAVMQANIPDRVTAFVNGELGGGPGGPGRGPGRGPGHGPGHVAFRHHQLDAASTALGMTEAELRAELQAGKTVAEVAAERGVDVQTVIDAMVDAATEDLTERITAFVNGEG